MLVLLIYRQMICDDILSTIADYCKCQSDWVPIIAGDFNVNLDTRDAVASLIRQFAFEYLLPARRRPQGLVVIGVCLSVCVCVCVSVCAHCICPQDISRTGSWITTKFGGWDQGVNL